MRVSRLGIIIIILTTVLIGTNCSYYNRILARKNLVDGANAYKNRKFQEAERLFRETVKLDEKGTTTEGRAAQLFLARTIHSEYIGNRMDKQLAEDAIKEYQRALEIEFEDAKLKFARELSMPVYYKKNQIGERRVDFFVEDKIMVELKAIVQLENVHLAQAINYLEAYGLGIGLLVNFGAKSLEFKRVMKPIKKS